MATNNEPTNVEKLHGLPWSIAANATNTVFVQFTFFGSVFVLFLSALGLSKSEMGFLLSLLPFAGVIAIGIAPVVERYGYKRVYVTFFGLRNGAAALLLLTPLVLAKFGRPATLVYVSLIVAAFSLLRSIGVTAQFPWIQEYVPNAVRGKYTATNNVFTTLVGFLAVIVAGYVLGRTAGLSGYVFLIAVGIVFGLTSVWLSTFIPGGAPRERTDAAEDQPRDLWEALRDRDFILYLGGLGLFTVATVPLGSFLPLYMREEVGLNPGNIVWLQIGSLAGGLISGTLWGWAADRYGSKPVTLSGILLRVTLPLMWMAMPQHSSISLPVALGISTLLGVADMGWGIGSARLLYVGVVPPEKKADYMALYYAWTGIAGGFSQLLGGWVLEASRGIDGNILVFKLSPYVPLFLMGLILPALSLLVFRAIRAEGGLSVGEFAGIFLRGNPFLAMTSLLRYQLARDEQATLEVTAQLGRAKSPLTVEELLEALCDPRFNVRFEAILAIARGTPDERLIEALSGVLHGPDPALSVMAAWALGRLGDERAVEALRPALNSRYRSVQAHTSRALGTLGDQELVPTLLQRLADEHDEGLCIAYASALGSLRAEDATPEILGLLASTQAETSRLELALALARILGDEHHFIRLLRQVRADTGTATAQELEEVRKRLAKLFPEGAPLLAVAAECVQAFARNEIASGVALLSQIVHELPRDGTGAACAAILDECAVRLDQYGAARHEYELLALHALQTCQPAWAPMPATSGEVGSVPA